MKGPLESMDPRGPYPLADLDRVIQIRYDTCTGSRHWPSSLTIDPSTRTAYSTLLSNQVSPPTSEIRILNHGFTIENIHNVYTLPFTITKDSKLIAFQYNIIHHILPTKSSLFRAGITESAAALFATPKSRQ